MVLAEASVTQDQGVRLAFHGGARINVRMQRHGMSVRSLRPGELHLLHWVMTLTT